jgi:DNA-binding NtrC family response regulator
MSERLHVLVVERDAAVCQIVSDLLADLGHRASTVNDAPAMRSFLDTSGPVDVVILEAQLSEAETPTLAEEVRHKGLRVVMMSGDPDMMRLFNERGHQLLHKPFRRAQLEEAIAQALASYAD